MNFIESVANYNNARIKISYQKIIVNNKKLLDLNLNKNIVESFVHVIDFIIVMKHGEEANIKINFINELVLIIIIN